MKHLKNYSAWAGLISFILLAVLAFVQFKTNLLSDWAFVLTEWAFLIIFIIAGIIAIKEK